MSIPVSGEITVDCFQLKRDRSASRARSALALLVFLGGCGGINVVRKQKLEFQPVSVPLRTFAFDSGLRVIIEKDTRTPLAGVFLVVGSGSSSDPAGKEGLAHYVEHLAFQSRPFGTESFSDLLDDSGCVQHNAFTDFDSTTYYEIGPASALPRLLRVEAVRMVIPVSNIPVENRAVELDVVRNELRERNETGFVGGVYSRMLAALFPAGHPYSRPTGGSQQTLSGLTKEDVDTFAKAHYRPDNMTLVLVGNIDLDTSEKLLADTLPEALVVAPERVRLPARLAPTPPAVPEPAPRPAALPRVVAEIAAPELWIGWTLPRGFDRDGYLLSFLASAAQQRLSRVRLDDHDITSVDVFPIPGKEASMLLCRVSLKEAVAPEKTLEQVLGEAPKIVNQLLTDPNDNLVSTVLLKSRYTFADMAYSRARRTILVGELLQMQNLVSRGLRRALVAHFSEDPVLLSHALQDLAELKPERFHNYALPYLTADRARAVLFVPEAGGAGSDLAEVQSGAAPDRERKVEELAAPSKEWSDELVTSSAPVAAYRLSNGLSVVLARHPGLPLVTASLSLDIDPALAKDKGSLAFARSMAASASRFDDPSEYGGQFQVSYGDDRITEMVEGTSGNAEGILATLAERARTMTVQRNDASHFKDFVLPSYQRLEREPHWLAGRDFFTSLLPDSPYARVPKFEELAAASYGTTTDWIEKIHSPRNATLVVAGDFEPKEIQGFIEDSFGGWKGAAQPPLASRPASSAPKDRAEVRILTTPRPGGTQGEIRFGCQLPEVTSGPVAVRHELFAEVARHRLSQILRERLGATYGVQVRPVELLGGASYLDLRTNVENGELASALGELHGLLEQLAAAPVGEPALLWARYKKASSVALSQMSNAAVASSILQRIRLGLSPDLAEVRQDMSSISAQDIQADMQYCLGSHPTLSIVGEQPIVERALKEGWR